MQVQLRSELSPDHVLRSIRVKHGMSIKGIVGMFGVRGDTLPHIRASIDGVPVACEFYQHARPKVDTVVDLIMPPQNGEQLSKETLRLAGSVGFGLAGIFVPQLLGLSGIAEWAVRAGISLLGIMAIDSLIPIVDRGETEGGFAFSRGGNTFQKFARVPKPYGKILHTPPLAARSYSEIRAGKLYIKMLLCLGYRPLKVHVDTIKIGETPIEHTEAVYRIIDGYESGKIRLELYSDKHSITEQSVNDELAYNSVHTWGHAPSGTFVHNPETRVYVTRDNTTQISLDLMLPLGLYRKSGGSHSVDVQVQYQPDGAALDGTWINMTNDDLLRYQNGLVSALTESVLWGYVNSMNTYLTAAHTSLLADFAASVRVIPPHMHQQALLILEDLEAQILVNEVQTTITPTLTGYLTSLRARMAEFLALAEEGSRNYTVFSANAEYITAFGNLGLALQCQDHVLSMQQIRYLGFPDAHVQRSGDFVRFSELCDTFPTVYPTVSTSTMRITSNSAEPLRFNVSTNVRAGRYRVRVRRASAAGGDDYVDDLIVSAFRSVSPGTPINPYVFDELALMELEIPIETTQSGSVDNVTMIVESPLRHSVDGSTWEDYAITDSNGDNVSRNNAWIFADMLAGNATRDAVELSSLDVESIYDWSEKLRDAGLKFDRVISNNDVLKKALQNVCSLGKAIPYIKDGLYSVAVDAPQTVTAQVLTPTNSRNFQIVKNLQSPPDALRVAFNNPRKNFEPDTILVYNDGFGPFNKHVDFSLRRNAISSGSIVLGFPARSVEIVYDNQEDLTYRQGDFTWTSGAGITTIQKSPVFESEGAPGRYTIYGTCLAKRPLIIEEVDITGILDVPEDPSHEYYSGWAERYGKYILKTLIHRPEVFSAEMNADGLNAYLGDRVQVLHDVALWGLNSGRVVDFNLTTSGDMDTVTLDQTLDLITGNYLIKFRKSDNTIVGPYSVLVTANSAVVSFIDTVADIGVEYGDLYVLGDSTSVTVNCIVREVKRRRDYMVMLTLVEEAPVIHDDSTDIVGQYDYTLSFPRRTVPVKPMRPQITDIITDERAFTRESNGAWKLAIVLTYQLLPPREAGQDLANASVDTLELQYVPMPTSENGVRIAHSWTSVGKFPFSAGSVRIQNVVQNGVYSVRMRSITRSGVFSDWTYAEDIRVVGIAAPPLDVPAFTMSIEDGRLSWVYAPPVDFAGFKVRYAKGKLSSWDDMQNTGRGVRAVDYYDIPKSFMGYYTFAVKAVDVAGNESRVAAVKTFYLSNGLDLYRAAYRGWGTLKTLVSYWTAGAGTGVNDNGEEVNFTEDGTSHYLEADADGALTQPAFPVLSDPGLFGDLTNKAFSRDYLEAYFSDDFYQEAIPALFSIYPNTDFFLVIVDVEVDDALTPKWAIEFKNPDADIWPEDLNDYFWPASMSDSIWPDGVDWTAIKGSVKATYATKDDAVLVRTRLHACSTPSGPPTLQGMAVGAYAPKIYETVQAFETNDGTGKIKLTLGVDFFKEFNAILAVSATIVEDGSYPNAATVEYNGGSISEIRFRVYDATHTLVDGKVDIFIEGF